MKAGWLDTSVWPYRLKKPKEDKAWDDILPEDQPRELRQLIKKTERQKRENLKNERKRLALEKKLQKNAEKEKKKKEVQARQEARIAAGGKPRGRPRKKDLNTL